MIFSEKLQLLRKNKGFTQEEFAEKLNVSRQAVAKWESGQAYPDISNLIQISNMMNVTVDYLVRDQECNVQPIPLDSIRMISDMKMDLLSIMIPTLEENNLPAKKLFGKLEKQFMQ